MKNKAATRAPCALRAERNRRQAVQKSRLAQEAILEFSFPQEKKLRVIVDTDAKNEADDQFAIVHALLTPAFDLHGIVPAHFGERKSSTSQKDSREEVMLLLELMGLTGQYRVEDGAPRAMPDEDTPVDSPGARLIIAEAQKDDPRPLHVAFYGPLTEMASALLLEPAIEDTDIRVVWIGGGPGRQAGGSTTCPTTSLRRMWSCAPGCKYGKSRAPCIAECPPALRS